MLRLRDIILLLVIYLSIIAGVTVPSFGSVFSPYTVHFMIFVLFLSFLPIEIASVWQTLRDEYVTVVLLTLLKTVAMPTGIYFLFKAVWPSYAVAAMLLSGVSTGIVAPFISNLVKGNSALVLVMVVRTLMVWTTLLVLAYMVVSPRLLWAVTPPIRSGSPLLIPMVVP